MLHENGQLKQSIVAGVVGLLALVAVGREMHADPPPPGTQPAAEDSGWHYNDEYIYAMTRGVNAERDWSPGVKITLIPLTLILDTALLPFEVIMGFFPKPASRSPRRS